MIVKLEGKADNHSLVFRQSTSGDWEATVPPDLTDGTYIMELTATDSMGYTSYFTTILLMVNTGQLCIQMLDDLSISVKEGHSGSFIESAYEPHIIRRCNCV